MRLSALKQILALLHTGEDTFPAVIQDACGSTFNLQSLLLSVQLQLLLGTLGPEVMWPSSQPGDSEGFLLLHYQVCVKPALLQADNSFAVESPLSNHPKCHA